MLAIRREINRRLFIFGLAVFAFLIKSADAVADQRSKGDGCTGQIDRSAFTKAERITSQIAGPQSMITKSYFLAN